MSSNKRLGDYIQLVDNRNSDLTVTNLFYLSPKSLSNESQENQY